MKSRMRDSVAVISSTMPSPIDSASGSLDRMSNASTAMEGLSDRGATGTAGIATALCDGPTTGVTPSGIQHHASIGSSMLLRVSGAIGLNLLCSALRSCHRTEWVITTPPGGEASWRRTVNATAAP